MCVTLDTGKTRFVFLLRALIARQNEKSSHKQVQLLDLRWEQMEKMNAWAKPLSQISNFANSTRPVNVRPGCTWGVFPSPHISAHRRYIFQHQRATSAALCSSRYAVMCCGTTSTTTGILTTSVEAARMITHLSHVHWETPRWFSSKDQQDVQKWGNDY